MSSVVDFSNLNGSVNLDTPEQRTIWDDINFYYSSFYQRTLQLNGGNQDATERWWKTPLPYPPFNMRAPELLLTSEEWKSLRDWLGETVQGGWLDDVDFFNESQRYGTMARQNNGLLKQFEATGGNKYQSRDGDWIIHQFTSSDTFTVLREGIIEYLLVGGGGGGGGNYGGGGGAGGSVVKGFKYLNAGTYNIVVGAGGSGGLDDGTSGLQGQAGKRDSTNGGNTTAFDVIAYGGGVGGGRSNNTFKTLALVNGAIQATPLVVDNSVGIGAGGGGGAGNPQGAYSNSHVKGSNGFGYRGGDGVTVGGAAGIMLGGGGGGAGGPGESAQFYRLTNVVITGTTGQFTCDPSEYLKAGLSMVVTGSWSGTGTLNGFADGNIYKIDYAGDANFVLKTESGGTVNTIAGTTTDANFYVTTRRAGAGGIGVASDISDVTTYYGGGGAGGAHGTWDLGNVGGLGGGASSKDSNLASNSTNDGAANTGGGGAGASGKTGVVAAPGGNGGSGIVYIRYPQNIGFGWKTPGNQATNY